MEDTNSWHVSLRAGRILVAVSTVQAALPERVFVEDTTKR